MCYKIQRVKGLDNIAMMDINNKYIIRYMLRVGKHITFQNRMRHDCEQEIKCIKKHKWRKMFHVKHFVEKEKIIKRYKSLNYVRFMV